MDRDAEQSGRPPNRHRRFIAGAVCPQCREMDRLALDTVGEERIRVCVSCGFEERLSDAVSSLPSVPRGRPEQAPKAADAAVDQVVRLIDPTRTGRQ